jgi:hypothetical protein
MLLPKRWEQLDLQGVGWAMNASHGKDEVPASCGE